MNEQTEAIRKQYQAPILVTSDPEVQAYIDRLEQGIADLAKVREKLYTRIEELSNAQSYAYDLLTDIEQILPAEDTTPLDKNLVKARARAHNAWVAGEKIRAFLTLNPAPAQPLNPYEEGVLVEAYNAYLYDWRENDDDETSAGWRMPIYLIDNEKSLESNEGINWDSLCAAGLLKCKSNEYQITPEGMKRAKEIVEKSHNAEVNRYFSMPMNQWPETLQKSMHNIFDGRSVSGHGFAECISSWLKAGKVEIFKL